MKERPILMSGPMVRAIIEDRKTMTRRVVNPQSVFDGLEAIVKRFPNQTGCPYGAAGDGLWCRETWRPLWDEGNLGDCIEYRADGAKRKPVGLDEDTGYRFDEMCEPGSLNPRWRPSIFMPRWACRLTLEVTAVRVERLQDITEADAWAEGVTREMVGAEAPTGRDCFEMLWDSINADRKDAKTGERLPYAWNDNPWVWCISFRRTER
jgi:hypothetical protein